MRRSEEGLLQRSFFSTTAKLLPPSATPDAARLITARMLRAFSDGLVSVLLPAYLTVLGYTAVQIGGIVTATLLGSAVFTLGLGLVARR